MTDDNEQDFTSQSDVLGAVLAQLEDLSIDERISILEQALQIQTTAADDLPFLTPEGKCPRCGSDLITYIDDHYSECCDCGWSGSTQPEIERQT